MKRRVKKGVDRARMAEVVANARRAQQQREQGYREQALALFPHVCGRCGREFSGENLRELTVHHKDHNHHNNPPDGSNWELLCVYCHDEEHVNKTQRGPYDAKGPQTAGDDAPLSHNPFESLRDRDRND